MIDYACGLLDSEGDCCPCGGKQEVGVLVLRRGMGAMQFCKTVIERHL
jgi:hypothetical protein